MSSLYLKYRPKTIEELDLTSVRDALGKIVKAGKTSHAYLFTGPRGAGKTSAARILARIVNCQHNGDKLGEPCNECSQCKEILEGRAVDVMEIDAASNRGIDDVRELKEKIGLAPARMRKKVYIVDEVHMMTTEAFNALLKTLEEPPEHALFILATTEAHKVPETIKSRTTRIQFTKATAAEMRRSFARVVKGEKAKVSEEALELLAGAVDGSFRDGVKLLEQVVGTGEVGITEMQAVLAGAAGFGIKDLVQALLDKDLLMALKALREQTNNGVDLGYLLVATMRELRRLVIEEGESELAALVFRIDEVAVRLAQSPVPSILVEMLLVEWCSKAEKSGGGDVKPVTKAKESKTETPAKKQEEEKKPAVASSEETASYAGSSKDLWQEMLKSLGSDNYSLGALLAKARPGIIKGNELTILVTYDFHKEQIMTEKHRSRIEELVSRLVGGKMRVVCEVTSDNSLQSRPNIDRMREPKPEEEVLLDEAVEIFS